MTNPVIVYSADPSTGAYIAPVEVHEGDTYPELYSTTDPGTPPDGEEWHLVDGLWIATATPTPEVPTEIPVIPVTITEVTLPLADGLYQGYSQEVITVKGVIPYIPAGVMTIIVQELAVSKILIREHRFNALIEETTDPVMRSFTLRLRFDYSGNYVITDKRLNEGLAEIGMPIRISMQKLDFNIVTAV